MIIKQNYSIKSLNSFAVDIKAAYYIETSDISDIISLIQQKFFNNKKFFILGTGSNTLFTKDFEGIIIKYTADNIQITNDTDGTYCLADSGMLWDDFVKISINNNIIGFENLAKIPSSVGAAAVQNIGAYGREQKDFFSYLEAVNLITGEKKKFTKQDCCFEYRSSIFKNINNNYLVVKVCYFFPKTNSYCINYPDLQKELNNKYLDLNTIYNTISDIRQNKLPDIKEYPNAGSFFKNPIISYDSFELLKKEYSDIKFFDTGNAVKIPAAWLIEKCGWKNKQDSPVCVYEKHALIIVNKNNASGQDIYNFSQEIINSVKQKFNIELEPEVIIL